MKMTGLDQVTSERGSETVNRYWDNQQQVYAAKLLPGQIYVCDIGEMVVSVLGSSIAVCIRDRDRGIGGMNQFMLPENDASPGQSSDLFCGASIIEQLIEEVLKRGCDRDRLEAKVFGAGRFLTEYSSGEKYCVDFVLDYLHYTSLPISNMDVGDVYARKIFFFPDTGSVKVRRLHTISNNTLRNRELDYLTRISSLPAQL